MRLFKKLAFTSALVISCGLAQAATPTVTYEFTESFVGSVAYVWDIFPMERYEDFVLAPEGSDLPSLLQSATQHTFTPFYARAFDQTYCYDEGGCVLTGGNAHGSYTGLYWVDYFKQIAGSNEVYEYAGWFEYTGGTGVFEGITGGGTFIGRETYPSPFDQILSKTVQGSFSLPVPEPATWGMMVAGLALVAGMSRRMQMPV
jgi:hypothetical protein